MIQSPQTIQVSRDGETYDAVISWWYEDGWVVEIASPHFETARARENDAFEALWLARQVLEPLGWRIGVAGAQINVYPSGMARDMGSGLRAYLWTERGADGLVDTFTPVDPATVVTVSEQKAHIDRFMDTA